MGNLKSINYIFIDNILDAVCRAKYSKIWQLNNIILDNGVYKGYT